MEQMTYAEVIRIAREAGFTIRLGKYDDMLIVEGGGNLGIDTLSKFAELIAERCEEIAYENSYRVGCGCDVEIRRKMVVYPDASHVGNLR